MDKLLARRARCRKKLDHQDAGTSDSRLENGQDALRCPPPETPVKILSGGERRRVALCSFAAAKTRHPLLDEPTNHLDAESVGGLSITCRVIRDDHRGDPDRYFSNNVAG